jgi:hypothetical protein
MQKNINLLFNQENSLNQQNSHALWNFKNTLKISKKRMKKIFWTVLTWNLPLKCQGFRLILNNIKNQSQNFRNMLQQTKVLV